MEILSRDIKLAIFDLDGTLIDSTGIWHQVDVDFFHNHNLPLPVGYFKELEHLGLEAAAEVVHQKYVHDASATEIVKEWRELAKQEYFYKIPLKEGAKELLETLKSNGVKLAAATANSEELYKPCLIRLGIYDYFEFVTDVNAVSKGKDSPEIYYSVCDKLSISKDNTIIFEDNGTALKTSFANGFLTIAVYDKASEKEERIKKENSHKFIKSFSELLKKY